MESGYHVTGYLYDYDAPDKSYVYVRVDNTGRITEISYYISVNIAAGKDENIERAKQDILKLNAMVKEAGVEALSSEILEECALPQEFISEFQAGSYYEEVSWSAGENVYASYITDLEEDYDEYSSSYIYFSID